MKLQGKVALVTGGGTGIGRAIALLFGREGAAVTVNYSQSRADAEDAAGRIVAEGSKAIALRGDVSQDGEAGALVAETVRQFGRLDILVNNAGWSRRVPHTDLEALTDEVWDRTLNINLRGAFYCARAGIPAMRQHGGGAIINITSVAGFTGMGSSIVYCASKAGMTSLTKSLARAFAPDIRVNAIAPGFVSTGFLDWPKEVEERQQKTTPLKRLATVDEVASIALFLAADATTLTGHTIFADGGMTILGPSG